MKLELIALAGELVNEDIYEVILPTTSGEIAVFPGHEPLVSVIAPGIASVRYNREDSDDDMRLFAVSGGVVEISGDSVRVLVDEADSDDDITEEEAREALKRAEELRQNASSQVEIDKAHQLVDRHVVRLKVAELKRRRRRL